MIELPSISSRQDVIEFEKIMQRHGEKVEIKIKDYFSDGIYAREAFIPKGTLLTGMIHKYEQLNIMSMGIMDILIDNEMKRVKAPFTVVSPSGTKRIALAIENTVWTTILRTELKDDAKIWDYFVTNNEEEYLEFLSHTEQLKLAI